MKYATDTSDYTVHWRFRAKSGFIGELFFVRWNSLDESSSTPVRYLIGFIEWEVKILLIPRK